MKRAEAEVIGAPLFQFYKTTNHINNINAAKYLLYGILGDHSLKQDMQFSQRQAILEIV